MERKIGVLIVILVLVPMLLSASFKTRIYQAYISNNMQIWKTVIDEMENCKTKEDSFLSELVNYEYGFIGYCLGINDNQSAEKYLDLAELNLNELEKRGYPATVIGAYRSAFYGYKIGVSPIKAPFIGPKSIKQGEQSIKNDPQHPLGYIQLGNAQFFMPTIFGGSKTQAIAYFQQAEKLMEASPEIWVNENWNYLNLLTLIGQSYEAIKEYKKAEIYFTKALEHEPNFNWVKNELLPKLEKTRNNE